MKSRYEIAQAKEEREKEKAIKEFNDNLKNNPQLLSDELYLFKNIYNIRLKLKQLPSQHLDNILLITEYFKAPRENMNFKYIKPGILNNPLFLSYAIPNNPELYFLISDENKIYFKETAIARDKEYLKYLSKEDFDNPEIIKKISFNFSYFQESLSCLSKESFNKIINGPYEEYVKRDLLKISIEQCQYLKQVLASYIEETKVEKGNYWFENLLNKNPYLYTILDKEKYKDEKSKELIISLTGKHHDLFPYLPKEWREDLGVVLTIATDQSVTSHQYQNHGMNYQRNVKNVALILNNYKNPEKFLNEKFNDTIMKDIRKIYPSLDIEWRKQPQIIKGLFKERDGFEIDLNYCRSIPNEELAENLVSQLKNFKYRELREIGETLEKVVSYHYMKENLVQKDMKEKKLKI